MVVTGGSTNQKDLTIQNGVTYTVSIQTLSSTDCQVKRLKFRIRTEQVSCLPFSWFVLCHRTNKFLTHAGKRYEITQKKLRCASHQLFNLFRIFALMRGVPIQKGIFVIGMYIIAGLVPGLVAGFLAGAWVLVTQADWDRFRSGCGRSGRAGAYAARTGAWGRGIRCSRWAWGRCGSTAGFCPSPTLLDNNFTLNLQWPPKHTLYHSSAVLPNY